MDNDSRFLYDDTHIQVFRIEGLISIIFHGNIQTTITFSTEKNFVETIKKLESAVEKLKRDHKNERNAQN